MQLAPSNPATASKPAPAPASFDTPPTYVGLRVSTDREFSAPMFADKVRTLKAQSLTSALVEARELLAKGAFNGPRDAAKAIVLLAVDGPEGPDGEYPETTFSAGSLVELRMGEPHPVAGVPKADKMWDYWYEPDACAVLDADELQLTR